MIKILNLDKNYGKLQVLKKINLQISSGKVTAIVGPNGSGKTTLIKTILGLVKPDNGKIYVNEDLVNGSWLYRTRIGYMPQVARYPENLTVNEVINLLCDLRGIKRGVDPALISLFRLTEELDKPFRNLSGGTKQKVSAVIAFLFKPEILILDEPTSGLDPVSSSSFKDYILKEKAKGNTIVLTSHIMSEVEELSDDIVFLLEGEITFLGTLESLLRHKGELKLERAVAKLMSEIN